MAKDKERTSLRLEPETMAMIKAVAAVTGVDMGTVVDRAIPAFVETLDEKNRRLVRDVVKSALAARSGAK